jgi:hypothetical protein
MNKDDVNEKLVAKLINIVDVAKKLTSCRHPLANLSGNMPPICGACGSVKLKGVGWSQPMLLHQLKKAIEEA